MPDQIAEQTDQKPKRYQCRHIFIAGARCGSPALRNEEFCYYHHATRRSARELRDRRNRMGDFELPPLEDRSSILAAVAEVLQRIASGGMHPKDAGLLLYGLQIASLNLPKINPAEQDATPVEQVVVHPRLGRVAPRAIVGSPGEVVEEEEIPEEELSAETKEEVEEERTSRYTTAEIEEMYRRAEKGLWPIPKPVLPNLQAMAAEPQIRVPHLRNGLIVAKVGEAEQIHPETPNLHPGPTDFISLYNPALREATESEAATLSSLQATAASPFPQHVSGNSCYPDLNHVKQTNRSHHPRRLGLPRRDQRQRHRACPQAHLRQAADHLSQHPHPRQ